MAVERSRDECARAPALEELYLAPNHAQATKWNIAHMVRVPACEQVSAQAQMQAPAQVSAREQAQAQAQTASNIALPVAQPLSDFAAKLWEQEGDGRSFASSASIILAAQAIIQRTKFEYVHPSRSLSHTWYVCLREGAGVPAFDAALEEVCCRAQEAGVQEARAQKAPAQKAPAQWASARITEGPLAATTPAEREALWAMAQTEQLLAEHNMVLEGRALALLAARHEEIFFEPFRVCLVGGQPLDARWQAFFDACPELEVRFDEPVGNSPLGRAEGRKVRLALPSGHYAQAQIVLDIIADVCAHDPHAHFVVTTTDALALYERIAPPLYQADLSCSVEGTQQLAHTDFGRMFFSAQRVETADFDWDRAALADALASVFSGVAKDKAWAWDKRLRGDRLLRFDDIREDVALSSALLAALLDGACDEALLTKAFNRLRAQGFSEAYVREQFMAAQGLVLIAQEARDFGLAEIPASPAAHDETSDFGGLDYIWELVSFPIHRVSVPAGNAVDATDVKGSKQTKECPGVLPQVRIMDMKRASQLAPRSTDVLIACDLTTANYALKESNSTAHMLLDRLGALSSDDVLARARRTFRALVEVPAHLLVCERPLNGESADPLYPSAMLEEFMAAYRAPDEEVPDTGIPAALTAGLYERGEEHLLEDVQPFFCGQRVHPTPQRVVRRSNLGSAAPLLVPKRADQVHTHAPRLSPSQIETYLECPYKWFAAQRLGADGLDEDLGPNRKGSFLHEIFKTFYERFGQKVTPRNLDAARALMFDEGGIFAEIVAAQYQHDEAGHPHPNRFVVRPGTLEQLELDELKAWVEGWLAFEATFLPTFVPRAFEFGIEGVLYQGCEIKGFIDRIDVDDQGRAVIIDYKGSLTPVYEALEKGAYRPTGKIQALLYASLVQEFYAAELGIEQVVGALYLSYRPSNDVRGAFNQAAIGVQAIPTLMSAKNCALSPEGAISFEGLCAFTNERAAQAISGIKAGEVAPCPASSDSCAYCPVLACEKREGK